MSADSCDNLAVIHFQFRLRPIAEISPWGPERRLHWFGLTDGWYWIEIGDLELLRYAPQTVQRWTDEGCSPASPYVDYYVVRLWEDLLNLLPEVLEPVPDDLAEFIASDPCDWTWPDEEQAEARVEAAMKAAEWYSNHVLDMGYLRSSPSIRWWRRTASGRDRMIMAWQHRPGDTEFAAPRTGQAATPTNVFVGAVEELDRKLLSAMDERIAELERSGPPPRVHIDMQQLRAEHRDRAAWLPRHRNRSPATDWAEVRTGADTLLVR